MSFGSQKGANVCLICTRIRLSALGKRSPDSLAAVRPTSNENGREGSERGGKLLSEWREGGEGKDGQVASCTILGRVRKLRHTDIGFVV